MYTHMHIDVTMRVKEETLNLRAVGTQEELKERMGRNDVNTVHMQEILRPMPEKKVFSKMILGCIKCIVKTNHQRSDGKFSGHWGWGL